MTRMTATDLARDFYRQGLAGQWLSRKRTDFLRSLSTQSRHDVLYDPEHHTYSSGWEDEAGTLHSWSLYISPINGCGLFNVSSYSQEQYRRDLAKDAYEQACREVNEQVMVLMTAGKMEEARDVLTTFQAAHPAPAN